MRDPLRHAPLFALLIIGGAAVAADLGGAHSFTYTGYLEENGVALNSPRALQFELFEDVNGNACQTLQMPSVDVQAGAFSVVLDDVNDNCLDEGVLYVQVSIADEHATDYVALGTPVALTSLPFASAPSGGAFRVGENDIVFTDPENPNGAWSKVVLSGSDGSHADTGVTLRTWTNPDDGDAIFSVLSSGGATRLRVEHNGEVYTDDSFHAAKDVVADRDLDVEGAADINGRTATDGLDVDGTVNQSGGNAGFNGIYLTDGWSGLGTDTTAEISNDQGSFQALMIAGNRSDGSGTGRKIKMYDDVDINDDLQVDDDLNVDGQIDVGGNLNADSAVNVGGNLSVDGYVQLRVDTTTYTSGGDSGPEFYRLNAGPTCNASNRGRMFIGHPSGVTTGDSLCICMESATAGAYFYYCLNP